MRNIDDELKKMNMEPDSEFDAYVEKAINKRIRKTAAKTCIAIVAAAIVIYFCVSPLISMCFPNAVKLNKGENSTMFNTMRAYYETMFPYRELCSVEAEKDGFGCYTMYLDVADGRSRNYRGSHNVIMEMKLGKLSVSYDADQRTTFELGRFYYEKSDVENNADYIYSELEKLPESAIVYLSVSQKNPDEVSDIFEKAGEEIDIKWIQVYQPESDFQAGVSTDLSCETGDTEYRNEMDAEEIKTVYIENLKTLRDNFDIWKNLEMYSGSSVYRESAKHFDLLIEAAEKDETFETKNYCISGSKEQILEYLNTVEADKLYVDKVSYSVFD